MAVITITPQKVKRTLGQAGFSLAKYGKGKNFDRNKPIIHGARVYPGPYEDSDYILVYSSYPVEQNNKLIDQYKAVLEQAGDQVKEHVTLPKTWIVGDGRRILEVWEAKTRRENGTGRSVQVVVVESGENYVSQR